MAAAAASSPFPAASKLAAAHPPPEGVKYAYGTAGFRMRAELLDAAVVRMGMLAALRAKQTGKAVGVMVTASHNPVADNGLKMVDPSGGMLAASWEVLAAKLANAGIADVGAELAAVAGEGACGDAACEGAVVIVGRDTRPSSPALADLVAAGVASVGGSVLDGGVVSTPQLHYLVGASNATARACESARLGGLRPDVDGYFARLATSYKACLAAAAVDAAAAAPEQGTTIIDAADGVGGPQAARTASDLAGALSWEVRNAGDSASLNDGCGAEFVQKGRTPPRGVDAASDALPGCRICSLDGDADRVVFHAFVPAEGEAGASWELVDGDKLAALLAVTVGALLKRAGGQAARLSMGVVQTAYANGAATRWVAARGLEVACAKTGVKFVHHAAEAYDVGVYFEANGHGTVVFSPAALLAIDHEADAAVAADPAVVSGAGASERAAAAAAALAAGGDAGAAVEAAVGAMTPGAAAVALQALTVLINQFVGDAIADALACEAALRIGGAPFGRWIAMYSDLPSRQTKVRVADRLALTTVPDESRLEAPAALQAAIDEAVKAVDCGRAFVRPSGTEDVVRVYAEAATVAAADELAAVVARAVFDLAGGQGSRP
ncbi:hypothetical protein FNF29_04941 [Cafeteria roenbergensis]|uniref:Phosphoacetylglucosamine mutase n=1 Tax=Cafeteria roenbergensis TaxID=33653 RepID=A0A5A8CDY9_CAFRO|nr:hypothetical protein FNF29_04941 [Cafeteria roenbergensis]|eukprot:KAA0150827.1 hypothetical protein FNF29_04941 [Cafeteria roenbergensis]